jgi:hypothetical protein
MVTIVPILKNYFNNVNKRTYTGFQRTVITFYCRELQVSAITDLC